MNARSRLLRIVLLLAAIGVALVVVAASGRHSAHVPRSSVGEESVTAPCASFVPVRGVWAEEPQGERARWSADRLEAEGRNVVRCRALIGRSEAQIARILAAGPVRPQDLGGAPGDDFRMWRHASGPALYVTFRRGRAVAVDVTHPECDADIWDC